MNPKRVAIKEGPHAGRQGEVTNTNGSDLRVHWDDGTYSWVRSKAVVDVE